MNKQFRSIFVLLLVFGFGLIACAPRVFETSSPGAVTESQLSATEMMPTGETATESQLTLEAAIDVEALILEKVAGHHDVERIYSAEKTREEWIATLDRMIRYGAEISEEEKEIIIEYLLNQ